MLIGNRPMRLVEAFDRYAMSIGLFLCAYCRCVHAKVDKDFGVVKYLDVVEIRKLAHAICVARFGQ